MWEGPAEQSQVGKSRGEQAKQGSLLSKRMACFLPPNPHPRKSEHSREGLVRSHKRLSGNYGCEKVTSLNIRREFLFELQAPKTPRHILTRSQSGGRKLSVVLARQPGERLLAASSELRRAQRTQRWKFKKNSGPENFHKKIGPGRPVHL